MILVGDMTIYHDGSHSYVTNATGTLKLATETSGIAVSIGHTTSEVTIGDNLTVTGTLTAPNLTGNVAIAGDLTVTISGSGGSIITFNGDDVELADNLKLDSNNPYIYMGNQTGAPKLFGIGEGVSIETHVDGTSASINVLRLQASTSGTVQAGFGVGQSYRIESLGGNQQCASLEVKYTDVTDGGEDADFVWRLMEGGAGTAERMRLTSAGDLSIVGDLTVTGNNISGSGGSIITFSGDDIQLADNLSLSSNDAIMYIGSANQSYIAHNSSGGATFKIGSSKTNTVEHLIISHFTSGTPDDNLGVGIQFNQKDTSGSSGNIGQFECIQTDITSGTENSDFTWNLYTDGTGSEKMRLTDAGELILKGATATIALKETSTPTAVTDYGRIYCKNDNKLYFQDGAGTEYTVDITAV